MSSVDIKHPPSMRLGLRGDVPVEVEANQCEQTQADPDTWAAEWHPQSSRTRCILSACAVIAVIGCVVAVVLVFELRVPSLSGCCSKQLFSSWEAPLSSSPQPSCPWIIRHFSLSTRPLYPCNNGWVQSIMGFCLSPGIYRCNPDVHFLFLQRNPLLARI